MRHFVRSAELLFDGEEKDLIAQRLPAQTVPDIGFFTGIITPFSPVSAKRGYKLRAGRLPAAYCVRGGIGFQLPVATIAFPWRCAADILLAVLIAPERKPIEESKLNVSGDRPPHADGGN